MLGRKLEFRSASIDNAMQIIKGKESEWKGKDERVMLQKIKKRSHSILRILDLLEMPPSNYNML